MQYRGSGLIRGVVKVFNSLFGSDSEDRAGVGPFSLPESHPFTRAAVVHDFYFVEARNWEAQGKPLDAQTLDMTDMKLFRAWVAIIYAQPTLEQQLELVLDLCAYFPAARKVGMFLWKGPRQVND